MGTNSGHRGVESAEKRQQCTTWRWHIISNRNQSENTPDVSLVDYPLVS